MLNRIIVSWFTGCYVVFGIRSFFKIVIYPIRGNYLALNHLKAVLYHVITLIKTKYFNLKHLTILTTLNNYEF